LQAIGDGMESRMPLIQEGEDDTGIARMESRTTPIQEEDSEDISTSDTYTLSPNRLQVGLCLLLEFQKQCALNTTPRTHMESVLGVLYMVDKIIS
jgi:hypothetical protein